MKREVIYGMGAQTRFGHKKIYDQRFFIHYNLNYLPVK